MAAYIGVPTRQSSDAMGGILTQRVSTTSMASCEFSRSFGKAESGVTNSSQD